MRTASSTWALMLLLAGLAVAAPEGHAPPLGVTVTFDQVDETQVACRFDLIDLETGEPLSSPKLITQLGSEATTQVEVSHGGRSLQLDISCSVDAKRASYALIVTEGDLVVLRQSGALDLQGFGSTVHGT